MARKSPRALDTVTLFSRAQPVVAGPDHGPDPNQDLGGQRHAGLTEIDAGNVARLGQAWVFCLLPADGSARPQLVNAQAVPIVAGPTMDKSASYGRVVALDAATGAENGVMSLPTTIGRRCAG